MAHSRASFGLSAALPYSPEIWIEIHPYRTFSEDIALRTSRCTFGTVRTVCSKNRIHFAGNSREPETFPGGVSSKLE